MSKVNNFILKKFLKLMSELNYTKCGDQVDAITQELFNETDNIVYFLNPNFSAVLVATFFPCPFLEKAYFVRYPPAYPDTDISVNTSCTAFTTSDIFINSLTHLLVHSTALMKLNDCHLLFVCFLQEQSLLILLLI